MAKKKAAIASPGLANHPVIVVLGALASIATIVTLVIYLWPEPNSPLPDPEPPATPDASTDDRSSSSGPAIPVPNPESFLEPLVGRYQLASWVAAGSVVSLPISVKEGELTVGDTGEASWHLKLNDGGPPPTEERLRPAIKCGGRISITSRRLEGVPGGSINSSINWTNNVLSHRREVWLTFCGWNVEGDRKPFDLSLDGKVLEMKNSKGTFTFKKR